MRIFARLAAAAVITVAILAVVEGLASAWLFAKDYRNAPPMKALVRPYTRHDSLLGWVNRPGFTSAAEYGGGVGLSTDAQGFRAGGVADTSARTQGLVCSGDAFTQGVGVDDAHTWCAALAALNPRLRTYNMGMGGYGLDQAYLLYKRDGGKVRHQVHLVGITDAMLERTVNGEHNGRFSPSIVLDGSALVVTGVPVPEQTPMALLAATRARVWNDLRVVQAVNRLRRFDPVARDVARTDEHWPLFTALFGALGEASAANGSRLVLVYLPAKRDVSPSYIDARRARLAAWAEERKVPLIDLTDALRTLAADSLDAAFISRVPALAAPGVASQYSNLGNAWVARALSTSLAPLLAVHAR